MPIIRRTILSMTACGVCLVVMGVVVWSWDVRGEHSVRVATTRQTPHAVIDNIVLLMMGIMMPETC